MRRLIAIGDIHGQRSKLYDLLHQIHPDLKDQIVFLGDYVDRGPNSKGVVDDLIDFKVSFPQTIFIRGNHDQLFLDVLSYSGLSSLVPLRKQSEKYRRKMSGYPDLQCWKDNGGEATQKSYRAEFVYGPQANGYVNLGADIPQSHIKFLETTRLYFEKDRFLFVHAGINKNMPLADQDPYVLMWDRDLDGGPKGKTLVVGHTPSPEGEPLIADDLIMIDTGAGWDGLLTALDLLSGQVWKAKI